MFLLIGVTMDHSPPLAMAHKLLSVQDVTQLPSDTIVRTIIWEKDGKEMVRVPAGKFSCGNRKKEKVLAEFWIDKTPVTNAEYARFVKATGHESPPHWSGKTPTKARPNGDDCLALSRRRLLSPGIGSPNACRAHERLAQGLRMGRRGRAWCKG